MSRAPDRHLQALLAEEPFVRALAGALAGGDGDDVAQQTWLLALQHPEPVLQPRSWLRRIVGNLAANVARNRRRRSERERAGARHERVLSSAELMEREERRTALVRAVDRLPVEMREVVLLRWFEGLPPQRIAAELGVPVSTVWNRLRSALQRLRERLDQEHGGDRRAWLLPLLPAALVKGEPAAPAGPMLLAGVIAMTTKTKLVAALAVLSVLGGAYALLPDGGAPGTSLGSERRGVAAVGPVSVDADRDAPQTGVSERTVASPAAAPAAATGSLLVRAVVGDDRRPARNETLVLAPKGAESPVTARRFRTDDAGQVRVDSLPAGAMRVSLLQYPQPRTIEIRAGQLTEFEFVLPAGLTVHGVVVDAGERPVPGAEVDLVDFGNQQPATVTTADADGRFMLRHVCPMSFLGARAADRAASRLQMLMGSEGGECEVRIPLLDAGGAVAGTVWGPDGRPVADAVVRVGTAEVGAVFSSLGMPPAAVPVRSDGQGRFCAVGLTAGEQRVFVRAAGLAPWQGRCFVTANAAASLRVDLTAAATCTGIVRDAGGRPAGGVEVRTGRRSEFTHCITETAADGTFTLKGLAPGPIEVRASHEKLGDAKATVAGGAGETVSCELELSRGNVLRGRVLDESGAPMRGVYVYAFVERFGPCAATDTSDADGRFQLIGCPGGPLTVAASSDTERVEATTDATQGELELRLHREPPAPPETVRIRGSVVGPDGSPVVGVEVGCYPDSPPWEQRRCATRADGSFELGPVRAGRWSANVAAQRFAGHSVGKRELADGEIWDIGRIQLVEGGTVCVQVSGPPPGAAVEFAIRQGKARFAASWVGERLLRTVVLAPGDYELRLDCEGCAQCALPLHIRAGEETRLAAQCAPGVRQRLEFARADGARPSIDLIHSLRSGDAVLIENSALYWGRPPVYCPDGAMTADRWLAPGRYRIDATDGSATGGAEFTVGEREGPPVRVTLR